MGVRISLAWTCISRQQQRCGICQHPAMIPSNIQTTLRSSLGRMEPSLRTRGPTAATLLASGRHERGCVALGNVRERVDILHAALQVVRQVDVFVRSCGFNQGKSIVMQSVAYKARTCVCICTCRQGKSMMCKAKGAAEKAAALAEDTYFLVSPQLFVAETGFTGFIIQHGQKAQRIECCRRPALTHFSTQTFSTEHIWRG